jgi:hypothetical protein
MASNSDYFLKKALGDDFFESLTKFELWKPGTRTTVDHEEIKTALQIVPRTIMSLLIRELTPMKVGENKRIQLPVSANPNHPLLSVTKHERDVYTGDIVEAGKIVCDFKYRSIPGIGLVVMSAFELYDTEKLVDLPEAKPEEDHSLKIQQLIDERLALHDLVGKVVDKKLAERDAIKELIMAKITDSMRDNSPPKAEAPAEKPLEIAPSIMVEERIQPVAKSQAKKESPLKAFLDNRKSKSKPGEFHIQMAKGEHVHCPDCGKDIFNGDAFSGCICLGDDRDRKVHITKTEQGIKVRFGRGWDAENIEMLLEVLRSKRG